MSYDDLKDGTTLKTIIFKKSGVPYQDPITFEMIYPEGEVLSIEGNLIHLSPSQIVARQQIQDDSRYKLVIEDTPENRTITSVFTATIENVEYKINGQPKYPQFKNAWITIYIKEL